MPDSPYRVLLGFDFGTENIGIAVGQTLLRSATPLATLRCRDQRPPWEQITAIVNEWQPDAMVVGMPYNSDGSAHALQPRITRFCNQLHGRYQKPVLKIDERLSSHDAAARQQQGAASNRHSVDAIAAQIILETWLQENS